MAIPVIQFDWKSIWWWSDWYLLKQTSKTNPCI